jgi:hypothetical protein
VGTFSKKKNKKKRKKGWYGLTIIVRSPGGNDDLFILG